MSVLLLIYVCGDSCSVVINSDFIWQVIWTERKTPFQLCYFWADISDHNPLSTLRSLPLVILVTGSLVPFGLLTMRLRYEVGRSLWSQINHFLSAIRQPFAVITGSDSKSREFVSHKLTRRNEINLFIIHLGVTRVTDSSDSPEIKYTLWISVKIGVSLHTSTLLAIQAVSMCCFCTRCVKIMSVCRQRTFMLLVIMV